MNTLGQAVFKARMEQTKKEQYEAEVQRGLSLLPAGAYLGCHGTSDLYGVPYWEVRLPTKWYERSVVLGRGDSRLEALANAIVSLGIDEHQE